MRFMLIMFWIFFTMISGAMTWYIFDKYIIAQHHAMLEIGNQ